MEGWRGMKMRRSEDMTKVRVRGVRASVNWRVFFGSHLQDGWWTEKSKVTGSPMSWRSQPVAFKTSTVQLDGIILYWSAAPSKLNTF